MTKSKKTKLLIICRDYNLDSQLSRLILLSVYGEHSGYEVSTLYINYGMMLRDGYKGYDEIIVVGINISNANQTLLHASGAGVLYLGQDDVESSCSKLKKHHTVPKEYEELIDAIDKYQRLGPIKSDNKTCCYFYGLTHILDVFDIEVLTDLEDLMDIMLKTGKAIAHSHRGEMKMLRGRIMTPIMFDGKKAYIANYPTQEIFTGMSDFGDIEVLITYSRNRRGKINMQFSSLNEDYHVRDIIKEKFKTGGGPTPTFVGLAVTAIPEEIAWQLSGINKQFK
ncbi:MAG: hypothetical protein GY804_08695 [Alphaproteobacteria bacterium]|nr:hypothetical protein [Alphaproteobacteria bacterium]